MWPAAVGLIGVVVGALITGGFEYSLRRRVDALDSRAAARLVRDAFLSAHEHATTKNLSQIMKVYDFQQAVNEWREHRGALAKALSNEEWSDVAAAAALAPFSENGASGVGCRKALWRAGGRCE